MKAPELPPSQMNVEVWDSEVQGLHQANAPYYTADQMHAFYRQGFAAGMAQAAQMCDEKGDELRGKIKAAFWYGAQVLDELAAAIRAAK
jgi:hypothetical protein